MAKSIGSMPHIKSQEDSNFS